MDAEKLTQVKLIILYMLARVDFLMTASQISDFVLGKDYADYYVLTQAQGELIENGLISQAPHSHNSTELSITTEGRDTINYFASRLPDFIKNDIENLIVVIVDNFTCVCIYNVIKTAFFVKTEC